jgi:hypothetical protein
MTAVSRALVYRILKDDSGGEIHQGAGTGPHERRKTPPVEFCGGAVGQIARLSPPCDPQ